MASASTPAAGPRPSACTNISAHTISGIARSPTITSRTPWRTAWPRQRPSAGPIAEIDSERVAPIASGTAIAKASAMPAVAIASVCSVAVAR